jgi:primase-polymerase (primpol)-like protein
MRLGTAPPDTTATQKRISLDFVVGGIPAELQELWQWVCWRVEVRRDRWGQLVQTKVPVDPKTGRYARTNAPATWAGFGDAVTFARRHHVGIGYVFSVDDPFSGVDLDQCRDLWTGSIAAWARAVIRLLDSYTEVSPSGTGVKVFIRGMLADTAGKRRGPIEIYSRARFFTVTGQRLSDSPGGVLDRQRQLDTLVHRLFPPPTAKPKQSRKVIIADDVELIERAMHARNGEKFSRLWQGDWSGDYPSRSEADAALCAMLAHWTAGDIGRIEALFRQSGLYREKWDRNDYRQRTIDKVLH